MSRPAAPLACLTVLAALPAPGLAKDGKLDVSELYQKVAPACVFVASAGRGVVATGAGVLIDADERLVLTTAGLASKAGPVLVQFPVRAKGGGYITHPVDCLRLMTLGVATKATVLHRDEDRNVALLRLDRVPAAVAAVSLAPKSIPIGSRVHTLGIPTDAGPAPPLNTEIVRTISPAFLFSPDDFDPRTRIQILITTNRAGARLTPGSPAIDRTGRLVGLGDKGSKPEDQGAQYLDVGEVRLFLKEKKLTIPEPAADPKKADKK